MTLPQVIPKKEKTMTNTDMSNLQPIDPSQTIWEASELRDIVIEMLKDPKMKGLARYIQNCEIFWSRQIDTACAGHGFIFFNPDFFGELKEEPRKTVMAHEVWHIILKHLERGKGCDPYSHNIAADHVINNGLDKDGFSFEDANPTMDKKYADMSTEQVYNDIYTKQDPKDRPKPQDCPGMVSAETIEKMIQEVLDQKGEGKTVEDQKKKSDKQLQGLQPGNMTGSKGIKLDLTQTIPIIVGATFEEIFEPYLIEPLKARKRSVRRPSRRSPVGTTLLLPGRSERVHKHNRLAHLVYALDVSGSISHAMAQQSHNAVRYIKELLNPKLMTVIYFDTHIKEIRTFKDTEKYGEMTVKAGGGTSLSHVYEKVRELKPEALVCFTDLMVSIPPPPNWDPIWITPHKRCHVPSNLTGKIYVMPKS